MRLTSFSDLKEFTHGKFEEFIPDPTPPKSPHTLVLCSGKVYYDLLEAREAIRSPKASIMRVEQFYPFHADKFRDLLKPYAKVKRLVWCQEEPQNMGAWSFLAPIIERWLGEGRTLLDEKPRRVPLPVPSPCTKGNRQSSLQMLLVKQLQLKQIH